METVLCVLSGGRSTDCEADMMRLAPARIDTIPRGVFRAASRRPSPHLPQQVGALHVQLHQVTVRLAAVIRGAPEQRLPQQCLPPPPARTVSSPAGIDRLHPSGLRGWIHLSDVTISREDGDGVDTCSDRSRGCEDPSSGSCDITRRRASEAVTPRPQQRPTGNQKRAEHQRLGSERHSPRTDSLLLRVKMS